MIRSSIPPAAYIDQVWFEKERKLFFEPLWQFATLKTLFKEENSYVAFDVLGREVVIQAINGTLQAFENICLHRQNRLQEKGIGNRPLVCQYHGWTYGENGYVSHIPFQHEYYQIKKEEIDCLKLKQYPLKILGNLIFINISNKPIDFDLQFSTILQSNISELSQSFDDEVLVANLPIKANWKLAYENLRDSLHPRFLHQTSLSKYVKFESNLNTEWVENAKNFISMEQSQEDFIMALQDFSSGGLNEPLITPREFTWHQYVNRFGMDDWYLNWLIFPNLHISSGSGGYSFIIEHHKPMSSRETDLSLYIFTAKKKRKYKYSPAVLYAHLEGALKTLKEDFQIVENIQSSLRYDSAHSINGNFELANSVISKWYMDLMQGKHAI
jgi:phenylpropionate dioxygenase-like ring-hydroxylating dioxygenase large terminal subunit